MAHSENSNMIRHYIAEFQAERITLEGLWYNIQTPLHILFEKEERLQVQEERLKDQEKRIQEQKRDIDIWNFEYKQKEAALAQWRRYSDALKAEISGLKNKLDYWYVEKVGYEKKEIDLKAEISVLKNKLDSLKELFLHNEEELTTNRDT